MIECPYKIPPECRTEHAKTRSLPNNFFEEKEKCLIHQPHEKIQRGTSKFPRHKDHINALLYALDLFEKADPDNKLTAYATKLKNKILKHGRTYRHKGEEKAVVYFYEQEAASLIKLLGFFISSTDEPDADFFSLIGKEHTKNLAQNANRNR